jgi:hypothetical protein
MAEQAFERFLDNAIHVLELIELHTKSNQDKKTHHKHEVLLKSCVVLLVACWEAFIEDTAETALEFILKKVTSPSQLPKGLKKYVAESVKDDKNDLKVWELAGDGWKVVAKTHCKAMLSKHLGPFNTPRAANVDGLYKSVLGLEDVSSCWRWKNMSNKSAKDKLSEVVSLRGAIAHRVQATKRVSRAVADRYAMHFLYLSIKTTNHVREHLHAVTGSYPWDEVSYNSVK